MYRSLEIVLPLMEHPSEEFLASVEEDLITLIMKCGQLIVQVCGLGTFQGGCGISILEILYVILLA